jgi:hypothetical protein
VTSINCCPDCGGNLRGCSSPDAYKAKVTTGSPQIKIFDFYNPVNGYLVSSNNNVMSGNSKIKIQEFLFKANSRGQLKIYTNEMINSTDHIIIYVM